MLDSIHVAHTKLHSQGLPGAQALMALRDSDVDVFLTLAQQHIKEVRKVLPGEGRQWMLLDGRQTWLSVLPAAVAMTCTNLAVRCRCGHASVGTQLTTLQLCLCTRLQLDCLTGAAAAVHAHGGGCLQQLVAAAAALALPVRLTGRQGKAMRTTCSKRTRTCEFKT